jgi:hypothetical protein
VLPKELTKVPRPNALPKNITLEELAQQNYVLAVQSALSEFKLRCPDYVQKYQSNKNAETIMLHVQKRGDETSAEDFVAAYHWALQEGLLDPVGLVAAEVTTPAPAVEQAAAAAVAAQSAVASAPLPATVAPIGTGMSNANQFNANDALIEMVRSTAKPFP